MTRLESLFPCDNSFIATLESPRKVFMDLQIEYTSFAYLLAGSLPGILFGGAALLWDVLSKKRRNFIPNGG